MKRHDRRSRASRFPFPPLLVAAFFLGASAPAFAAGFSRDEEKLDYIHQWEERDSGSNWNISPGLGGGPTNLADDFTGYPNTTNYGLDVYFRPPTRHFPTWKDHMIFRFSADALPLDPPDTSLYDSYDIYSIHGVVLWRFVGFSKQENKSLVPFVGGGAGISMSQWETVPILGMTFRDRSYFFSTVATAGFLLPCVGNLRLIPEVRYSSVKFNDEWASYVTYRVGLAYWLPAGVEE